MVIYVQNKLIKITIIADISIIRFNASSSLAKRCSFTFCFTNSLCIRNQIATFFTIRLKLYYFMRGLCVVYVSLGQTWVNENTTNLDRVLYLCLTLDWRWSDVLLASTFTRGKTLTFLNTQRLIKTTDHNCLFFCALNVRDGRPFV